MSDTLSGFVRVLLLVLAALLPIINPIGQAPIFLSLTRGVSDPVRSVLAGRIARHSFALLSGAMLVGSYVLIFFGLSVSVVKIAGGLLVVSTAWHLIRTEQSSESASMAASAAIEADRGVAYSFHPLTFPITIGPGSLSVAVTLGASVPLRDITSVVPLLGAVTGILLVSCAVYLCYRFASRVLHVIGGTGTVVLLRMSAFILLSVGVKILCDGLDERFGDALSASR